MSAGRGLDGSSIPASRSPGGLPSGDVTFVISDVEGSTALLKELGEDRYGDVLHEVLQIQRDEVEAAGGVLVSVEGDGCFFAFGSTSAALDACAVAQARLQGRPGRQVHVRMGCHVGHGIRPLRDTYAALAVHETARVAASARGGQVLVTAAVDAAAPERCVAMGVFHVRDFDAPIALYAMPLALSDRALAPPGAVKAGARSFPAYRTSYVDRVVDRARLMAALSAHRFITLVGPGGTGKTRLVIESLRGDPRFAAAWFVDLTALPGSAGVESVRDAVRGALADVLEQAAAGDLTDSLDGVLRDQAGLLILDNCEHLLDAAGDCADELLTRCRRLHVLCTSREPLGLPDEVLVRLDGLDSPGDSGVDAVRNSDAGRLFLERAQQVADIELTPHVAGSIASLARRLDGMPLALELVASMTWETPVEELESRIADHLADTDLTRPGRGRPARHVSLRAVIEWSVSALDAPGRRALAALALAVPPIAPRTAHAAFAPLLLPRGVEGTLADLARRSLVVREENGTARLLETIRAYAGAMPDLEGLTQVILESLAEDCIDAGPGEDALALIGSPDLAEVAPTALAMFEQPELAASVRQRLAWAMLPALHSAGPGTSSDVLDRAVSLDGGDDRLRARLHQQRALVAAMEDDHSAADLDLARAQRLIEPLADPTLDQQQDYARCVVLAYRDEIDEAVAIIERRMPQEEGPYQTSWLRQLAGCYFLRRDPRTEAVTQEVVAGGDRAHLLSSANEAALRGDGRTALARVLEFLERDAKGVLHVAMAMDVIGVALGAEGYFVEAFALCLFCDRALVQRGYVPYRAEVAILEAERGRARSQLTPEQAAAAEHLAEELDLATARELGVRLAQERLATVAARVDPARSE